ncbi:MAG: Ku protein [Candidatus Micrarchaeia archaeon]
MRAVWKGTISFGLVSIPIKMYPAIEPAEVKFHFLHKKCGTPLRYERHCPACGVTVPWEETVRGFEYAKGRFVTLRPEELALLPLKTTRTVDIQDFVALEEVDPIFFETPYFLAPAEGGERAYELLRRVLATTRRAAIGKVAIRGKEHLVLIREYRGALAMSTMYYPREIRSPESLIEVLKDVVVEKEELELATQLIDRLTTHFEPEKYKDEYRKALLELIRAKAEGRRIAVPASAEVAKAKSLMAALRASVEAVKPHKKK